MIMQKKFDVFMDSLDKYSQKISLYNYSNYLITKTNSNQTGFIYFSWNNFYTGLNWDYNYICQSKTWTLVKINQVYSWVFCEIDYKSDKIYNHKFLK